MKAPMLSCAVVAALSLGALSAAYAGSATWNTAPVSGDWNTAANWMPNGFPNDPAAVASFNTSTITDISLSGPIQVADIVFNPGASAYTITAEEDALRIMGTGIINNSGVVQNLVSGNAAGSVEYGKLAFYNSATIGEQINITSYEGNDGFSMGEEGGVLFYDNSSAGNATIVVDNPFLTFSPGSLIEFNDQSTAGNSHITLRCTYYDSVMFFFDNSTAGDATVTMEGDGFSYINFYDSSSAGNATFTFKGGGGSLGLGAFLGSSTADHATLFIEGATTNNGSGGGVSFSGGSPADATLIAQGGDGTGGNGKGNEGGGVTFFGGIANATVVINGGTNGGLGGHATVYPGFEGTGRVEIFANGTLEGSGEVGSIEGDGQVTGAFTVGSNNLSTAFSGLISGNGNTLVKTGTGTLTLSGANTYARGTTITAGTLSVSNKTGSGTGTGAVSVQGGTLAGHGTIAGAVAVGNASGTAATLDPAGGTTTYPTLTVQGGLTFNATAAYSYTFKARGNNAKAVKVIGNGVTINSGATFNMSGRTQGRLTQGLVLTVISNTSATPIAGTFSNLPDGGIVNVNGNNFQASYSGGDGNDLTLTVVP